MKSFRTQLVVSTSLLVAVVMVVLVVGTQAVLEWTAHREIDHALAQQTSTALDVLHGSPSLVGADLEPGTRIYDSSGARLSGTLEHAVAEKADETVRQVLATGHRVTTDAPDDYHLQATPYNEPAGRGVVVVAEDADPYERSEEYALIAQIVLGVIAVTITGAVAWRVSRKALEPVQRMARTASDWSEHDLGHRFALGPPTNELAALGETLDHLLDRVAQAIRSEQRLTSELAHELRTPLTAIRGWAEVALMRLGAPGAGEAGAVKEDLTEIAAATRRMDTVITTLLALARGPQETHDARCEITQIGARLAALVPDRLEFTADLADDLVAAAPEELVVRALAPLVENASHYAVSRVTLTARAGIEPAAGIEVLVGDDGAGVAEDLREHLFEPGRSGRGGTGLGLGIARRVARSLGGDIVLGDEAGPGAVFVLTLPRA